MDEGRSYRHDIASATGSQALFTLDAEGHLDGDTCLLDIVRAGDIDRDGRRDLLVSLPGDNCAFDQRLYLSSRATRGEVLRLSAHHTGSLQACGY